MKVVYTHTWEQAVNWLRQQTDLQSLVRHCYYDDPLESAAERFSNSEEWRAVADLLKDYMPAKVLDIGAGRGISSYAFAKEGCTVTSLEPDSSDLVGAGAIRKLFEESELSIEIVEKYGESLPFESETFDIVYGRAVLHHARDLPLLCNEMRRVLKRGGIFVATREHVISSKADLKAFLDGHPLHSLYGGENAYLLAEYKQAIASSGLKIKKTIGPMGTVINYAPMTKESFSEAIKGKLSRLGESPALWLSKSKVVQWLYGLYASAKSDQPGRHYSFLATKK